MYYMKGILCQSFDITCYISGFDISFQFHLSLIISTWKGTFKNLHLNEVERRSPKDALRQV